MPQLTRTVAKLEDVAQNLRHLYKANDEGDGFVLDVEIEGYEDPTNLKKALKAERQNGKIAARIKKLFPDADDDEIAERVEEAIKAAAKAGDKKGGAGKGATDEEVERLVEKRVAEKMKEVGNVEKERDTFRAKLERERVDNALRKAFAGKIPAERVEQAIKLARADEAARIGLDDSFDNVVLRDADGDPMTTTLDKWVEGPFKKSNAFLFEASGASGSGAPNGARRTAPTDATKLSPTEKVQQGLAARRAQ